MTLYINHPVEKENGSEIVNTLTPTSKIAPIPLLSVAEIGTGGLITSNSVKCFQFFVSNDSKSMSINF